MFRQDEDGGAQDAGQGLAVREAGHEAGLPAVGAGALLEGEGVAAGRGGVQGHVAPCRCLGGRGEELAGEVGAPGAQVRRQRTAAHGQAVVHSLEEGGLRVEVGGELLAA